MIRKTRKCVGRFIFWCGLTIVFVTGCQKSVPMREIVFVSDRSGNQDIYLLNIDADSLMALTQHEAEDWSPAWTPDGSKLAFASTRDGGWNIYLMNVTNQAVTKLTDSGQDRRPAWSPDGKRLTFTSDREGNSDIYVMKVDGSDIINISTHRGRDDRPIWSPDGERIAFSSNRSGDWDLYLFTLSTGALRKVTDLRVPSYPGVWFQRNGEECFLLESNFDVVVYSLASAEEQMLAGGESKEGNPDRSVDGQEIVYESDRSGDPDIWYMKADSTEVRNLTNHPAFDWYPRWRP